MKLYMVPLAPNPTKVMLYIAERAALGIDLGIEQIVVNTVKGRHKEPEHLARNPFGTVPVLELNDGRFLIESLAIMEYLDERFPERRLLEGGPEERARMREIERIVDVRVASAIGSYAHMTKSPLGYPPNPDRAQEARQAMQSGLNYLESLLSDGRALLTGDQVSIADCTLQASLQFIRYIDDDVIGERPMLRAWDTRYRDRPAARVVLRW